MYHNRYDQDFDVDEQPCEMNSCECDCECEECCEPQWCVGPTGPMGPRGPKGSQGPRGLQGQQGREGLQGLRGPQGVTGPQGIPGIQGPTGATGAIGLQGPRGVSGATGPQGPQGPQGNTGPAGQPAPVIQFASASLTSFSDKTVCPGEAMVFDIGNIQSGFTISEDYESLIVCHQGTYVVEYGCLLSDIPCLGDALAIEINREEIIEESRIPLLCENSFVRGTIMLELHADDSIRMICDGAQAIASCAYQHTVNAFLLIYQIR